MRIQIATAVSTWAKVASLSSQLVSIVMASTLAACDPGTTPRQGTDESVPCSQPEKRTAVRFCGRGFKDLDRSVRCEGETLADLKSLDMFRNPFELKFEGTKIASLDGLEQADSVRKLSLSKTGLRTIEELRERAPLLWDLTLDEPGLETLAGLEGAPLTALTVHGVCELKTIATLEKLERLTLVDCDQPPELPLLAPLTSLSFLALLDAGPLDVSTLPKLHALQDLHLVGSTVTGLERIPEFPRLEGLFFDRASLESLAGLHRLSSLARLGLEEVSIKDWTGLAKAHALPLERLNVRESELPELSLIAGFGGLKSLTLDGVSLSELDTLAQLRELDYLSVVGSKVPQGALESLQKAKPELRVQLKPLTP